MSGWPLNTTALPGAGDVPEQEMTKALAAAPNERTRDRVGYRAGHYPRSLVTRVGKLELRVTRDRGTVGSRPSCSSAFSAPSRRW